ncbi:hypothetical protein DVG78_07185 [Runella aurantiaca]|uniref:Uncharacterized protein n=1 Tax=Runella aurantiaca TaxID=2282308 RepID=A0A369IGW2_9BACT|nr:hypothetical protein DVG78_07185 [Runella aurantiaca]
MVQTGLIFSQLNFFYKFCDLNILFESRKKRSENCPLHYLYPVGSNKGKSIRELPTELITSAKNTFKVTFRQMIAAITSSFTIN